MYKTIVVAPAILEPVTLTEAVSQLRIEQGFDDAKVTSLISVARDKAERYCNRYFTEQTVKIVYSGGFGSEICLPFPDLISVESITYLDSENAEQTINSADYSAFFDQQVIYPASEFPTDAKSYTVTVITGAPAEMSSAKIAMLMYLTDLYELREESVIGASVANNPAVAASLYPYRVNLGV